MPRKAPDGKGVIEHRITLGNYEREQLKNTLQKSNDEAFDAALMKQAPLIIIAGGVGIAAYSLWRWVGLGSIIERVKDGIDNVVSTNQDTWAFATTGDITQTETGSKIHQDLIKAMKDADEKYYAKVEELELIINDPNTSPNVKAQAESDLNIGRRGRAKQQKKFQNLLDKIAGN